MVVYKDCYCIKDFYFGSHLLFKKYNLYIMINETPPDTKWVIYNINGGLDNTGFRFRNSIITHFAFQHLDIYDEYFCSIKEYRKLKLQKIYKYL